MDSQKSRFLFKLLKSRSEIFRNRKTFFEDAKHESFSGKDLVSWLENNLEVKLERNKIVDLVISNCYNPFLPHQLIYPIVPNDSFIDSSQKYYRFIQDQFEIYTKNPRIINLNTESNERNQFFFDAQSNMSDSKFNSRDIIELSKHIRIILDKLFNEFLSDDGKALDYIQIMESKTFNDNFLLLIEKLAYIDITPLMARNEMLMAFFINMYNTLNIHSKLSWFKEKKTFEIKKLTFYDKYMYNIGGYNYSLNDIEHGILRKNSSIFTTKWNLLMFALFGKEPETSRFGINDPRAKFVSNIKDARIHFALNCGAKSCPPIRIYSPDSLEQQLQKAAISFCNSDVSIEEADGKLNVKLSAIFKWYHFDFGQNIYDVLAYVSNFLDPLTKDLLSYYLQNERKKIIVSYLPYDWTHNGL